MSDQWEWDKASTLAEAWDEGYGAGWNDCLLALQERGKQSKNPYREEQK